MNMIELDLPNNPTAWASSKIGKKGHFNPKGKEKAFSRWQIKALYRENPIEGYVVVDLVFFFPIPNSTSKKQRALMLSGELVPTHVDATNCQKFTEDCLKGIVFNDDRYVSKICSEKLYAEKGKILIKVWPREEYLNIQKGKI